MIHLVFKAEENQTYIRLYNEYRNLLRQFDTSQKRVESLHLQLNREVTFIDE